MSLIGIIGGGVVGLSTGIELLHAGHRVALVDDDAAGQAASWGNAGHIAVEQVEPLASWAMVRSLPHRLFMRGGAASFPPGAVAEWLPFGLRLLSAGRPKRFATGCAAMAPLMDRALPAWSSLLHRIGAQDLLRSDGHLVLWNSAAAAQAGRRAWEGARTGPATVHPASGDDLSALSRICARPISGAVRFSGTAQIADLGALRHALRQAFIDLGGALVQEHASLQLQHGRVQVHGLEADKIIVCAGVRSGALMKAAGHKAPIIAERGYHVRADLTDWPRDLPPVVFEERAMIVTRYRQAVQAASFVEMNRPDAPADPRKWERLETHIAELGLPISGPFRRWMGCRPTLPDYLPAMGRSTRVPNLYYAFGHQHLGLTLAPVTGRLMASVLAGEAPDIPLGPFDIERFS